MTDVESLRLYCLSLPGSTEDFPFDETVLAVRVGGKIFGLIPLDAHPPRINLKCDPARAEDLRARHPAITPGYHMSKKHWNTVMLDGSLAPALVRELIGHSHELIVASLPAKTRRELEKLSGQPL